MCIMMNCRSVKSCEVQRRGQGVPSSLEVMREKGSPGLSYAKLTGKGGKKVFQVQGNDLSPA